MYLHLGSDCMVRNSEIIAIFNLRHAQSSVYKDYVRSCGVKYRVVDVCQSEDYASCVLTDSAVYLSPISSLTLKKRLEEGFYEDASYLRNAHLVKKNKNA